MDGSLRRRGQLLVVVGALLGAMVGVTLGLVVDDSGVRAAPAAAPDRGVAAAAATTGSQPPTSRTVGAGSGDAADRPGKAHGKDNDDKAKPKVRGKAKPKGKEKSERD